MSKRWVELESQAGSERPEDRVDAIVKSHARVEPYLKPSNDYDSYNGYSNEWVEWSPEVRWAVQTVRNKVVHQEYDPTIEETQRAVRAFWKFSGEDQVHHVDAPPPCVAPAVPLDDDDIDRIERECENLEEVAKIYDHRDILWGENPEWWDETEKLACSLDQKERTEQVKDAYNQVNEYLEHAFTKTKYITTDPKENFEIALNEMYNAVGACGMQCDEASSWAYLLAEHVVKTKYEPSIAETYRVVHVFREIASIITRADYASDNGICELYSENFGLAHGDASPKSINEIASKLNMPHEQVIKIAEQIGFSNITFDTKMSADEALLVCRTIQTGLFLSLINRTLRLKKAV